MEVGVACRGCREKERCSVKSCGCSSGKVVNWLGCSGVAGFGGWCFVYSLFGWMRMEQWSQLVVLGL
jgi:hypothetical protein